MTVLDAHVHLWDTGRLSYPWLDDVALPRVVDVDTLLAAADPVGEFVVVQADCRADQALAEVAWLHEQARHGGRIAGIVAYAPVHDPTATAALLTELGRFPLVVGVRRLIQDEPSGFTARSGFRAGAALLATADLACDLCVREHQLGELVDLVEATPDTRFVLDHLGKPHVGADPTGWRRDLAALAALPNVACKLSGLLTELVPGVDPTSVRPYLEHALEVFGPQRCLFASDWPVLTLGGSYRQWLDLVSAVLDGLPGGRTGPGATAVLHGNARTFYRPRHSQPNGSPR